MRRREFRLAMCAWLTLACCAISFVGSAAAATEKVLYSFTGGNDGSQPDGGLTRGPNGSFYGSTFYGGTANQGVVFQLTHSSTG